VHIKRGTYRCAAASRRAWRGSVLHNNACCAVVTGAAGRGKRRISSLFRDDAAYQAAAQRKQASKENSALAALRRVAVVYGDIETGIQASSGNLWARAGRCKTYIER